MTTSTIDPSEHDAAVNNARAEGAASAVLEGTNAAKARIKAILGSEEAKGRTPLAEHIAFETDMSADAAIEALSKAAAARSHPLVGTIAERLKAATGGEPDLLGGGGVWSRSEKVAPRASWDNAIKRANERVSPPQGGTARTPST